MPEYKQMGRIREILVLLYTHGPLTNRAIRELTDNFYNHQDVSFRLMENRSIGLVRGPILKRWELTRKGRKRARELISEISQRSRAP